MRLFKQLMAIILLASFSSIGLDAQQIIHTSSERWLGCEKENFVFQGYPAHIVYPPHPLPGNPWIWRASFPLWHVEIDSLLLTRGFAVAYIGTVDLYGSPRAMIVWDAFYNYLVEKKGFALRPALEGVSRGGLYVYAWAKRNPSRVSCIYGEGLVCDIKSWPGRTRKDKRNIEWAQLLQVYGFTEAEALNYDDNPYQNLEGLASFKVPVYHAIGLHDSSVINEENTFKLVHNYVQAGGIATIHAMTRGTQSLGGHHYPIERPDLIADFIEGNSYPVQPMLDGSRYQSLRDGLDNCRMTFQRSKQGVVAFLGGSPIQAAGWRGKVCKYLQELFPATRFTFINAGLDSTRGVPGTSRLDRDVLGKTNVDLLFVGAAVDNRIRIPGDSLLQAKGMEGIMRFERQTNPFMDIVLLHFIHPDMVREFRVGDIPNEIAVHENVAEHYGVPSINLVEEVNDRINAGEFTWENGFNDLHPSVFEQDIYFQSIKTLLHQAWRDTLNGGAALRVHAMPPPLDR